MKMGHAGPPLSHAVGRRQASLGTPVPGTPTVIFIESYSNFVRHACCRAIICLLSFISHRHAICYLYTVLLVHTLHPYSHYCFLCMGILDSDAVLMNTRQKSLQCNSKISTKRLSACRCNRPRVCCPTVNRHKIKIEAPAQGRD